MLHTLEQWLSEKPFRLEDQEISPRHQSRNGGMACQRRRAAQCPNPSELFAFEITSAMQDHHRLGRSGQLLEWTVSELEQFLQIRCRMKEPFDKLEDEILEVFAEVG